MRRVLDITAAVGLVNLLALIMVVVWLSASDRLDADRLHRLREMFVQTIAQEQLLERERAREAEREAERLEAKRRDQELPPPSDVRLDLVRSADAAAAQAEARLRDQVAHLRRELLEAQGRLQRDRAAFETQRDAWNASIENERRRRSDEQFSKAVRQMELLPARNARDILLLLAATPTGMETAVAYIDAMAPRSASRVLRELRDEAQTEVARDLLEALRTFGLPEVGTDAADDQPPPIRAAQ